MDAFEAIYGYDAEMKVDKRCYHAESCKERQKQKANGKKKVAETALYWKKHGLVDRISEVCLAVRPDYVYGFFTGRPEWGDADEKRKKDTTTKYRYFFTAGVKKALSSPNFSPKRAGCFYGREIGALKALGWCFYEFAKSGFDEAFVEKVRDCGYRQKVKGEPSRVEIRYEEVEQKAKP